MNNNAVYRSCSRHLPRLGKFGGGAKKNNILDRDALYYPYIHVQNLNWLKATLLCFPQLRTMIPRDFALRYSTHFGEEGIEIEKFRKLTGARHEPLLTEVSLDNPNVYAIQQFFLEEIQEDRVRTFLRKKYSKIVALNQYADEDEHFHIHRGKFTDSLLSYLESEQLAWNARLNVPGEWYAVHPKIW